MGIKSDTTMLSAVTFFAVLSLAFGGPLWDYVNREDGCYNYEILSETAGEGFTTYVVNLTSQCWLDDNWSSQSTWFHYMGIVVPDELVVTDLSFMFIGLGNNDDGPMDPEFDPILSFIQDFAVRTGAVGALINQVPNQPIKFRNDPFILERYEDAIIAFTWIDWMRTSVEERNPDTMVLFAMAKGVSKGL